MTPETRRILRARKIRHIRWFFERNVNKLAIIVYILFAVLMLVAVFSRLNKTRTSIEVPTPAPVITPIATQSAVIVAYVPTDEEMIKALPNGQLVWQIYGHESTWGKFDSCKAQGKVNGFGYGQSKFGYRCFDSLKEVATHVSHWLTVHLQTQTIAQALCEYNTGKITNTCNYERYTQSL